MNGGAPSGWQAVSSFPCRGKKGASTVEFLQAQCASPELFGNAPVPDDRSGQLMRKSRHKTGEIDWIAQGPRFAAIDIDGVAH
jgi:hypothetical protein